MYCRTVITAAILLTLLLISTLRASAATSMVNIAAKAQAPALLQQILNTFSETYHEAGNSLQNQFSRVAEGCATDPYDRDINLPVRILWDGIEVAQTTEVFRARLYAGATNWDTSGQVWGLGEVGPWLQVSEAGFGGGFLIPAVADLAVFQGRRYAGTGWNGAPG
jgi:hypothetical protein